MQNFNVMGHIKVSQIRIHLIENIEKYIGTCIKKKKKFLMFSVNPTQVQLLMGPTIGMMNLEGLFCKVVIYNYVLCWLYSMTKNVVIALISFLVFCGILLYWI